MVKRTLNGWRNIQCFKYSFFMYKTSVTEQINILLFSVFIICMFLLYWSGFYLFISSLVRKFSRISYYLISIGWIPYFLIIGSLGIFICAGVFSWNDNMLDRMISIFNLICSWGLPVSLIIAYIRSRKPILQRASDV